MLPSLWKTGEGRSRKQMRWAIYFGKIPYKGLKQINTLGW